MKFRRDPLHIFRKKKNEKVFDLFQFFFLNAGVDVIEPKDAFVFVAPLASLAPLALLAFSFCDNFKKKCDLGSPNVT